MRSAAAGSLWLLLAHFGGSGIAGDRHECIVEAGTLDCERLNARAALDQRLEQRLRTAFRQLEHPFLTFPARIARNGLPPGTFACPGSKANDGPQPRPRL